MRGITTRVGQWPIEVDRQAVIATGSSDMIVAGTCHFATVVPPVGPSADGGRDVTRKQHGTSQFSVCTHHPPVRLKRMPSCIGWERTPSLPDRKAVMILFGRRISVKFRQETKVSANGGSRTVGGHALSLWESVPSVTQRGQIWIETIFRLSTFFRQSAPSPRPRSRTPSRWGGAGRA